MFKTCIRVVQALVGLGVLALGLAMLIAGEGPDSWGVLLLGLQQHLPLSLGVTAQAAGLVLIIVNAFWGKRYPGVATVFSMVIVGFLLDLYLQAGLGGGNFSPVVRLFLLAGGILIMALGIALYVSAKLGEGPVEGLMFVLSDKLKLSVSRAKVLQDVLFVLGGLALGWQIRPGTLLTAIAVGPATGMFLQALESFSPKKKR